MLSSRLRRLLPLVLLIFSTTALPGFPAQASDGIESSVDYRFGEWIEFKGRTSPDLEVKEVLISIRARGEADTFVDQVELPIDGVLSYHYNVPERPLRPFTTIDYWFTVTPKDGEEFTSEAFNFLYNDNRFNWQYLSNDPFRVYWFAGDLSFAQSVLDVATEGLNRANNFLPLKEPPTLTIYIYENASQIPETPGKDWVAGHAYPDLGLMVVSLPDGPERRLEMERQIPHELMHILLYETIGQGYENLPTWFNEGLSTMAQLYPTPEYQILLENALKNDSLLPIASLCQDFSTNASSAYLSYAEATYFTRYIYRQYGSSGLSSLLAGYADGLDCERGAEVALGISLSSLEERWLNESLGVKSDPPVEDRDLLMPWFFLLFVVLAVPLSLATVSVIIGSRERIDALKAPGGSAGR